MNEKFQWKAKRERKAFIALADGSVFHGYAFGEKKDSVGEAVFNTGMGLQADSDRPVLRWSVRGIHHGRSRCLCYGFRKVRIQTGFLERHRREFPRLGFQGDRKSVV